MKAIYISSRSNFSPRFPEDHKVGENMPYLVMKRDGRGPSTYDHRREVMVDGSKRSSQVIFYDDITIEAPELGYAFIVDFHNYPNVKTSVVGREPTEAEKMDNACFLENAMAAHAAIGESGLTVEYMPGSDVPVLSDVPEGIWYTFWRRDFQASILSRKQGYIVVHGYNWMPDSSIPMETDWDATCMKASEYFPALDYGAKWREVLVHLAPVIRLSMEQ